MGFAGTQKIVTSLESEEFLDIVQSGDSIISYDDSNYMIVNDVFDSLTISDTDEHVILVVGEIGTNVNNWDIKTTINQNIFTIENGYVPIEDLQIGDILRHIDGISVDVKTITRVSLSMVEYSIDSIQKHDNFFINGILFKI